MYIIIVGGGRVGYYLAKALLEEGHEVLIIEKNRTYCQAINDELGTICFHGDGCETTTLEQVGTKRADMLIAVTEMNTREEIELLAEALAEVNHD